MPDSINPPRQEAHSNGSSAPLVAYVLKQRSTAFHIFLVLLVVGAMTAVRALFGLVFPNAGFFSFYFPAVMIVTIMTGWRMGLACIGLSIAVAILLFMKPFDNPGFLTTLQWLATMSFIGAALLQVAVAQWLRTVLQQMERNENRYRQLVSATSGIVWTTDATGKVLEPQPGWREITGVSWPHYAGHAWMNSIHEEDRGKLCFTSWDTDSTGTHHAELRLHHAPTNEWRWFAMRAVPIRDSSGNIHEWVTIITDVHDRKLLRERRELVIGELRHRLKNLFTVIGSLAQSSRPRGAPVVDEFISKLNGRLNALSVAADLVVARGHGSLELGTVIRATLTPFMEEQSSRIELSGPAIELQEETGGAIALAVHELTTNALKYGALSAPQGKVNLRWQRVPVPDGERVDIEWKETGGPACSAPQQQGFGMRVIRFAAAHEKSGEVVLDYPADGLYCRISFVKPVDEPVVPEPGTLFEAASIF